MTTIKTYAIGEPPPAPTPQKAPIPTPVKKSKSIVKKPLTKAQIITNKRKQINQINVQVTKLDMRLEQVTEQYNATKITYETINHTIAEKENFLLQQNTLINELQIKQNAQIEYLYREGKLSFLDAILEAKSVSDFFSTWSFIQDITQEDASNLNDLAIATFNANQTKEALLVQRIKAIKTLNTMNQQKRFITNQMTRRKKMIAGIEADIFRLQHPEVKFSYSRETLFLSGPRSEVASLALNYLGKPYVWAAAGPNSFDCSGLTLYVYSKFGISLPHSAAAQYQYGKRISKDELQSGDLVFFYSPIHHVGIYLGNGLMIHAPHAGDVVRIAPLSPSYVGAIRL